MNAIKRLYSFNIENKAPVISGVLAFSVLSCSMFTSPIIYAIELGSLSDTNISLSDGDVINADTQSSDTAYYGIYNDHLLVATIDLASDVTINDIYPGQRVKGISLNGNGSTLSADSLSVMASGSRVDGIFISGNHDFVDLGSGSQVNVTSTGAATGITVSNDSKLVADNLTINVNSSGGGRGLYLYQQGSSADLGSNSTITTQGDSVNGVYIFGTNGTDGSTEKASFKANELSIVTTGAQSYGINQQANTVVDLGDHSTITTYGTGSNGVYTFGDFSADALTIETHGTSTFAVEVQKAGSVNIGADSHITAEAGQGIAVNGSSATFNFSGSDESRNTISVGGNYAATAQNGGTLNMGKTDIDVTGQRYAIWALSDGVINGNDMTITSAAGTSGVAARSGGTVNLTGPTVINMANVDDNAVVTEYVEGSDPGQINIAGKVTMNGSVYAEQGDINLDMQTDSVWTGKSTINHDYDSTVDVSLTQSQWNMTDSSELSHLTMDQGTVVFPDDSTPSTLTVDTLEGSGTFAMNAQFAEQESDMLNVTGNATGEYSLHVANTGKEPAQSDQDMLVVHTGGGDADFSVPGGKVDVGTWEYDLVQKGDDWYLSQQSNEPDTPDSPVPPRNITPSADAILSAASSPHVIFNAELQNLRHRHGDVRDNKGSSGGVWGRWFGSDNNISDTAGSDWTLQQLGMAVGGDHAFEMGDNQGLFGAFVSFSDNQVAQTRGGESNVDSGSAGVYSTIFTPSGLYIDGVLKVNHFTNNLFTRMSDGTPVSGRWQRNSLGGTLEAGWMLPMQNAFWVEPWVRMTAFSAQTQKVALTNGMTASLGNDRSIQGAIGFNAGYDTMVNSAHVKPWIKIAAVHEFIKKNPVWINESNQFNNDLSGTAGLFGAGINVQLTKHGAVFAEVDYQHGRHIETPIMANAGFRINF
ncbi:MAG: autotransporter outer membrane beta-barrel domain-containing protein [Aeromonadaceae bacterium]